MRILFISLTYPSPWQVSAGTFNQALVGALRKHHVVGVIAPVAWRVAIRSVGAEAHRSDAVHPVYLYPPGILHSHHGAFLWHSIKSSVRRIASSVRPEAVLAYWSHPDGYAALRAAHELGVPGVVIVGGSDVLLLAERPARRAAIRQVLLAADAVLAVGRAVRQRVLELGVGAERVHLLRRGVDGSRFCPGGRVEARARLGLTADRRLLLWVGRMVAVKGIDILLEACRETVASGSHFALALVGGGELEARLRRQAQRLGLDGHVLFVGPVAHERLADWYRAADLTVLPSRSEGVPNVLLESLACGTPFVASDVGSVRDIDPAPFCEFVPPGDVHALAEVLCRRLRDPSTPGGQALGSFSMNDSATLVTDVLQKALRSRQAASSGAEP